MLQNAQSGEMFLFFLETNKCSVPVVRLPLKIHQCRVFFSDDAQGRTNINKLKEGTWPGVDGVETPKFLYTVGDEIA